MKKLLAILWLTVSFAYAQEQSTPNLITSGTTHTWTGVTTGSLPAGCATAGPCPGGPSPIYDPSTNTISWSYNSNAYVGQVKWVNQALQGTGIQINGYSYSYDVRNMNGDNRQPGTDTLLVSTALRGANNSVLLSSNEYYNTKFEWRTVTGTKTAVNPYALGDVTYLQVGITGGDNGYWGGYFGPQVRNFDMRLNYSSAPVDPCMTDPLSSPSCPGYTQAMCSSNPLFSQSCPGYTQAMCSSNSLFDPSCPGYAAAYLTYQCSTNPLYATTCAGYDQAYFNQQCSISPLYSQSCDGYGRAYYNQQCNLNPLYDVNCPGYAQAYAIKYVVVKPTQTEVVNVNTTSTNDVANSTTAVVSDPVVNQTITTTTTSVSPATSATAVVPLVSSTSSASTSTGVSNVSTSSVSTPTTTTVTSSETKPSAPTTRQELQAKRQAAARAEAIEKGKNLANEMGKVSDMESQKQVQNVVIQAMGFTPGFDTYGKVMVPDAIGYKPFTIYNKQFNVDNAKLGRRMYGPSDALHTEMVNMQWEIK